LKPIAIRIPTLTEVIAIAGRLARRTRKSPSSSMRIYHAHQLFLKAHLHGRSIQALVVQARRSGYVDISGLCGLARLIIEAHNAFAYLGEPNISADERELRFQVMHLNESVDLIRISRALGIRPNDSRIELQEYSTRWSESALDQNRIFRSFPQEQREKLLQGRRPFLSDRYKGDPPIPKRIESAAYNLFSHNVHSFGLSSRFSGELTPAGARNALFLAIEIALIYLSSLVVRYRVMRPRTARAFTGKEKAVLDDALSANHLQAWIDELGKTISLSGTSMH
jgi:hypothetical protein